MSKFKCKVCKTKFKIFPSTKCSKESCPIMISLDHKPQSIQLLEFKNWPVTPFNIITIWETGESISPIPTKFNIVKQYFYGR